MEEMSSVMAKRIKNENIVEAKLYPGGGAGQSLARPRLDPSAEFLTSEASVALICAPAGYGKSMVMSRWYELLGARQMRCGWLTLDEDDNDCARFLRHLIAAFQRIDPDIGEDALSQLPVGSTENINPLLESLAADLGGVAGRAVLFLDDLHFVIEREVLHVIHWLVNYSPRQIQYVLGSRHEPAFNLSGLRVRRRLCDLHARDLGFTASEASQFFALRLPDTLAADQVQRLLDKTEGWAAALELLAAALRHEPRREALITGFTGSNRSAVDYLAEMLLNRMEPEQRDFIARIAQFDRINGELAAVVSGNADASALLTGLHARNLFLIPLDQRNEWFRLHHLVSDFLRDYLWRRTPETCRQVLIDGARWLFEQEHVEEAIGAAIRAKAWEDAARWLSETVEELVYRRGYHQTLMRWMELLPEEWVDRFPAIRINYAFALGFDPRQREVEAQLHRLEQSLQRMERASRRDQTTIAAIRCAVEAQVSMSQALRDEGIAARDGALAWLARWTDAPAVTTGHMCNVLAFGYKTSGDIDLGFATVARARRWHEMAEGYYGLSWNFFVEVILHMKRGAYREARQACLASMAMIERYLHGNRAQASLMHAALAAVAYEFDEIEQAQSHIDQVMLSIQDYGPADAVIMAYLTRARLQFLRGDADTGHAILHEGQELGARRQLARVEITLAAEECAQLWRSGRHDEAQETAMRFGILRTTDARPPSGLIADKAARVASMLRLREQPGETAQALQPAIAHCAERGFYHRWVELLLLQAVAYKRNQDLAHAMAALGEALRIAVPRQYVRVFLNEGQELTLLLERALSEPDKHAESLPLIRRLLKARSAATPAAPALQDGLRGELTKREIALLKRLDSGMSNREIAESVFISEGTLKWHLHNIYGKLGARNRSGALICARRLGLL